MGRLLDGLLQGPPGLKGDTGTNGVDGAAPTRYATDSSDVLLWLCDGNSTTIANAGTSGSSGTLACLTDDPDAGMVFQAPGLFADALAFPDAPTINSRPHGAATIGLGNTFTVSGWYYIPALTEEPITRTLIAKWVTTANGAAPVVQLDVQASGFCIVRSGEGDVVEATRTIERIRLDDWNHISFGSDGAVWFLHVNSCPKIEGYEYTTLTWGSGAWTINGNSTHGQESLDPGQVCPGLVVSDIRGATVARDIAWHKNVLKYGMGRRYA